MNEDWEQVTPFLNDMQHCTQDDYFNPQEVCMCICIKNRIFWNMKIKSVGDGR